MEWIDKLVLKFLTHESSKDELEKVSALVKNKEDRKELLAYQKLWIWSGQLNWRKPEVDFDETWKKIEGRQTNSGLGRMRVLRIAGIAASVLILLNIGWWTSFYFNGNGAQDQSFEYVVNSNTNNNTVLHLPDSTLVYLRPGSELKYDSEFNSRQRIVSLEGEAFFEVTKNAAKPFVVKTEKAEVTVLGTKFNVFAEKGASTYQSTLVEGKVMFRASSGKRYILHPDQMLEYKVNSDSVNIVRVNTQLYTSWKDGKIMFRDETLAEITSKLERIYHVKFVINNKDLAEKYRFSGTFNRETSVAEVITMLKKSIPMKATRVEQFPEPDIIYLE
ncbi:FecR family protein [Mangrovibacterium diazotrophicum]|uniref:FecR family protein n=1 Tax=Mangrovibacterium diazotrophicum TaxID=1261403 RepID=A0A419VYQ3_9BACT|nr:FecR domain-containing protein [Mangrovibacterium diazotrophicum]RKD88294.1 FecR family protein [Mangrovibacterium diazotrophicum]